MLNYCGRLILLAWSLLGSISAATIASVGNPNPNYIPGFGVNEQYALSVSWTQTKSYTDVSVYAPLGKGGANDSNPAYAYLTNRVGLGTTAANEIAKSVVYFSPAADPTIQLFNGLTLGPGSYYVTLWSPVMAGGGWSIATDPNISLDEGVTLGPNQYAYRYVGIDKNPFVFSGWPYPPSGLYIPETISVDSYPNDHLVFSVTGTEVITVAPEPHSISLTAISLTLLSLLVLKIRLRQRTEEPLNAQVS